MSSRTSSGWISLPPSGAHADIPAGRLVPRANNAVQQIWSLLDHLVGEREQLRRNFEAKRLRGLQIDHKLELGRLNDREIGRLGALENLAGVNAGLAICIGQACSVAH